jgi:uncharacterized membrane protein
MSDKNQDVVGILVAAFPEEASAEHALKVLEEAKGLNYVHFESAALVSQNAQGEVHYHETGDMSTGKGSGIGAVIGGVIGILGGPAGVVVSAGAGAIIGGALAHGDAGFKDASLEQLGVALKPSTSALALTTSDKFLHKARKASNDTDLRATIATLGEQLVAQLEQGNNVALGLTHTDEGLTIIEVAVKEKLTEFISVIAAKDGVIRVTKVKEEPESYYVPGASDQRLTSASNIVPTDHAG